MARCWWCGDDPTYVAYHDTEWGRPLVDDVRLFEKISLECFMSGLSWITILRKRDNFRAAFEGFEPETVAGYGETKVSELMADAGIVRNRAKIEATIGNAQRCLELIADEGSLAGYVWAHEPPSRPGSVDWDTLATEGIPEEAVVMSRDLKRRGWRFVGPTTLHSVMESGGLVNNHVGGCDVWGQVEADRATLVRPTRV
jgi:DNA-3-methyladenine glycosylase I